jgi:hypothetical protein
MCVPSVTVKDIDKLAVPRFTTDTSICHVTDVRQVETQLILGDLHVTTTTRAQLMASDLQGDLLVKISWTEHLPNRTLFNPQLNTDLSTTEPSTGIADKLLRMLVLNLHDSNVRAPCGKRQPEEICGWHRGWRR